MFHKNTWMSHVCFNFPASLNLHSALILDFWKFIVWLALQNWCGNDVTVLEPKISHPLSGPCSGGLLYQSSSSNMQGVTSAAFLLTSYARSLAKAKATVTCGYKVITPTQLTTLAQKQVLHSTVQLIFYKHSMLFSTVHIISNLQSTDYPALDFHL